MELRQQEAHILAHVQPLLHEHRLLPEHWRILAVLDEHPGTTMTTLAAAAVVPAASLTRHVDTLVERSLVVRRVHPDDRRRAVLALSSRGLDLSQLLHRAESDVASPVNALS